MSTAKEVREPLEHGALLQDTFGTSGNHCTSALYDGGHRVYVKYPLLSPSGCDGALDVGFLVDTSGSIRHERFSLVQDFIQTIVSALEISSARTRVGVISYADTAALRFPLNQYSTKQDILHAISLIPFTEGKTNTQDGLRMAKDELFSAGAGDRPDVPNVLVVFTDGVSNVEQLNTVPMAIQVSNA